MISESFEKFANGILFTFTLPERESHIDDNSNLLESESRVRKLLLIMSFILSAIFMTTFFAICNKNTEQITTIGKIVFEVTFLTNIS